MRGLGQIRFPNGNISANFEEIRAVLEREGLVGYDPAASRNDTTQVENTVALGTAQPSA